MIAVHLLRIRSDYRLTEILAETQIQQKSIQFYDYHFCKEKQSRLIKTKSNYYSSAFCRTVCQWKSHRNVRHEMSARIYGAHLR